jgi:hypothetical protein
MRDSAQEVSLIERLQPGTEIVITRTHQATLHALGSVLLQPRW